jgi:putative nucleotidyltransferase with HDIG domain
MKSEDDKPEIKTEQIQIGVYVHLDLGWMDHPFSFNNFKIKDEHQIKTIKSLGLDTVNWDPAKSDVEPLPLVTHTLSINEDLQIEDEDPKKKKYAELREKISAVEAAYIETISAVESAFLNFSIDPQNSVRQFKGIIHDIVSTFDMSPDFSLHLVSSKGMKKSTFCHALNVSVMTTAFAHKLGLESEVLESIGTGAMLHDIGLLKVPEKVIKNPGPLNKAEIAARKHHCRYGLELTQTLALNKDVLNIIYSHHELYDGSGFPDGKRGEEIPLPVRLVSLVNHFDNLCNPPNSSQVLTTHDALSILYRKQRKLFDPDLLNAFVRFLGVYPPGSIVNLSDNSVGIVIKVYDKTPLRPTVMVYSDEIPKNEAIIIDLREEMDLNITKSINPSHLPNDVFAYLNPQTSINYYFDRS